MSRLLGESCLVHPDQASPHILKDVEHVFTVGGLNEDGWRMLKVLIPSLSRMIEIWFPRCDSPARLADWPQAPSVVSAIQQAEKQAEVGLLWGRMSQALAAIRGAVWMQPELEAPTWVLKWRKKMKKENKMSISYRVISVSRPWHFMISRCFGPFCFASRMRTSWSKTLTRSSRFSVRWKGLSEFVQKFGTLQKVAFLWKEVTQWSCWSHWNR